jgi:class 3 adenylate cyclase
MEPRIQYARTSDGVSIAFCVMGEGPPLVRAAVPGWNHAQHDWVAWSRIFPPLTQRFRVILHDSRGTGLSDRSAMDFSMDAMLRDLDAVVARVGLDSFGLCSWINGVPIAIAYAATRPERVSHLVLVDGWARARDFPQTPARQVADAVREKDWVLYTETVARVLMGVDDPEYMRQMAEHMRACIVPAAEQALAASLETYDIHDSLSRVQAQTLVVQNQRAPLLSPEIGQRLAAEIPDARFMAVDDLMYERVAGLIEDFLLEGAGQEAASEPAAQGLKTILFTDVEGSTALTQRLGDARAREVLREHERIVREALRAHGGSEVKALGDGFMASFSSATRALECAIAMQRAFAASNAARPEPVEGRAAQIRVRIGLNAGEPIAEEADLFGTAVNLAARIAAQAEGGEILVANVVRELAAGKGFLFADRGETALRGFEDPVRLYEVRWGEEG